jgi:hypothetical protein
MINEYGDYLDESLYGEDYDEDHDDDPIFDDKFDDADWDY